MRFQTVKKSYIQECWAAPRRPASLVVAQPGDQRKTPEAVTETSVAWIRGSYTKGSWSDTPPLAAEGRQDMAASSLHYSGEGGYQL